MASIRERFREIVASFLSERPEPCEERRILAAVSGGADSVFLLALLESLSKDLGFSLAAVTVNHRLRAEEESAGDAAFVEAMCASFVPAVKCFRVDFAPGDVEKEALKRGMGIEDAARFLRYKAFEEAHAEWNACCVMTGHTSSDKIETVLMRFLQGAGASRSAGILPTRDYGRGSFVFRPMLSFSAEEVRSFLKEQGIPWREDSTNSDSRFLRNKIRLNLLPFLDSEFPGWRKAVLCGAEKSAMDLNLIESLPLPEWKPFPSDSQPRGTGCAAELLFCPAAEYAALLPALRLRFLYRGTALLGMEGRVPYRLLRAMIYAGNSGESGSGVFASGAGIFFESGRKFVFLGRDIVQNRKNGYLVMVRGECTVPLPFGEIRLRKAGESGYLAVEGALAQMLFKPPFAIRSRTADDFIEGKGGMRKSLKKLFGEWGVPVFLRGCVPVIETQDGISAVLGSALGFPDFIANVQKQGL